MYIATTVPHIILYHKTLGSGYTINVHVLNQENTVLLWIAAQKFLTKYCFGPVIGLIEQLVVPTPHIQDLAIYQLPSLPTGSVAEMK
jgi:hypothetical protein